MEAVECGAAALAIVLAHFGRFVPLEELRIACGVSRDGSKASNMVKAARRYGLENRREWLGPLLLAMAATAFLSGALTWLQQTYLLRLETRMAVASSSRFLWHVLRLPVEFYNQRFAGDISARVGINDRVAQLLSRDLATNSLGAVMIVFFAALLFRYDAVLTLVGIAVISGNVAALRYVPRKRVDGNRRLGQDQGKLLGTAIGGLQTIETLKATGGESDLFARWAGFQAKVANGRQGLGRYTQLVDTVPPPRPGLT